MFLHKISHIMRFIHKTDRGVGLMAYFINGSSRMQVSTLIFQSCDLFFQVKSHVLSVFFLEPFPQDLDIANFQVIHQGDHTSSLMSGIRV